MNFILHFRLVKTFWKHAKLLISQSLILKLSSAEITIGVSSTQVMEVTIL